MGAEAMGLISLAVVVAAFVQGTIGVGFALIVVPVIGLISPSLLPASLLMLMLPFNLYVAWRERDAIDRAGSRWITGGRILGTLGGLWILTRLPPNAMTTLVGASTVLAAAVTFVAPAFRPGAKAYVVAGAVTGLTETSTGIGGPPLALLYQHRSPPVLRSTLACCFFIGQLFSLAVLAVSGRTGMADLRHALLLTPALLVGTLASRLARDQVDARRMRPLVLIFAMVSGLAMLFPIHALSR